MIVKNTSKRTYSLPGLPDENKTKDKNQYFVFTPGDNEISKENLESVIAQNKAGWNAHYCKVLIPVKTFTVDVEKEDEPDELQIILQGNVNEIKDFVDSCENIDLLTRLLNAEDEKEKSRITVISYISGTVAELKDRDNPSEDDNNEDSGDED